MIDLIDSSQTKDGMAFPLPPNLSEIFEQRGLISSLIQNNGSAGGLNSGDINSLMGAVTPTDIAGCLPYYGINSYEGYFDVSVKSFFFQILYSSDFRVRLILSTMPRSNHLVVSWILCHRFVGSIMGFM